MTDLTVTVDEGVALLTLNRPERRNAYTASMGELLSRAYEQCDADDDVRAIVLTGAGEASAAVPTSRRRRTRSRLQRGRSSRRHRSIPRPSSYGRRLSPR